MTELENTALWRAFAAKADDAQRVLVRDLTSSAAARLALVRDTFPTYTLHDRTHSLNVVGRIGDLLGPDVEKLTALEAALLILGAFCHDIGMVFTEEERERVGEEPHFADFLKEFPEAALRVAREGGVATDVAEAYCRWIHPDRVYEFLKTVPEHKLLWGRTPLLDKLGAVCRSHGYDVRELLDDEKFKTDYLSEADLRFCAVMLRLGDILDFDNTRAPEEVYGYLGLARRDRPREKRSDVEWLKHLGSEGFRFPAGERQQRYPIKLVATPDHPAVEYDVREFLDTIESELQKCAGLLKHCSRRWQDFPLPGEIDRGDIHSRGYKYGAYRFTLEQQRILELLMGENLYEDPYVFVRELLQNAIDTSRHRAHFERSRGRADFRAEPIVVSTWLDQDSYRWVRVDDYGMGMSEEIIANYFLKVGESYYRSARFRADQLAYEQAGQPEFVPVSRFGIGVLSCFIAGDRVEVSTRYAGDGQTPAHSARLQLSGLHSFYVLQSERDRHYDPAPMPGPDGAEADYRRGERAGTSVAVRLDPRRENRRLDLKATLERYLLCPPVPVLLDGEPIGGDPARLLDRPWADGVIEEELTDEEMAQLEALFEAKFAGKLKLRLVSLNLTAYSSTPNLKGQAMMAYLYTTEGAESTKDLGKITYESDPRRRLGREIKLQIGSNASELIRIVAQVKDRDEIQVYEVERKRIQEKMEQLAAGAPQSQAEGVAESEAAMLRQQFAEVGTEIGKAYRGRQLVINLNRLLPRLNLDAGELLRYAATEERWLAHNGIIVPTHFGNNSDYSVDFEYFHILSQNFWLRQLVILYDALRPNISLSRDRVMTLSWDIYSAITLAALKASRAFAGATFTLKDHHIFEETPGQEYFLLGTIIRDPLIRGGEWAVQKIIETEQGAKSLEEIRAELRKKPAVIVTHLPDISSTFYGDPEFGVSITEACAAALVQTGLKMYLRVAGKDSYYVAEPGEAPLIREGQKLFPPLFFVPYEGADVFRYGSYALNQNHPFSAWLIEHATVLHEKYPGIFDTIRKSVAAPAYANEEELAELNAALDRLWVLDKRLQPARKMQLRLEDFARA